MALEERYTVLPERGGRSEDFRPRADKEFMSSEITKLENGLIVSHGSHAPSRKCGLGRVGRLAARVTRAPREAGLSHMLEHMAFKGTETRSAKDIAIEIEAVAAISTPIPAANRPRFMPAY